MGHALKITIPWKHLTSKNAKFVRTRRGQRLSAAYRKGKDAIHLLAKDQYDGPVLDVPVHFRMETHMPDRRRRDVQNYLQQVCDALEGVVYVDDWQIHKLTLIRHEPDRENPRAEIEVTPL